MTEHDHGNKAGLEDVAGRVRAQLTQGGLSQAAAARQMGLSASALSQLLAGTYPGDLAAVTAKALAWLNRADRGRDAAPALVADDDFVETETASDILRSLEYVQTMGKPGLTMIAGGPGVGKTQALREFAAANTNVWIATVNRGAGRPFPFLETVSGLFRIATRGEGVPALITKLCDRLAGTRGILILDECQHLGADALETARGLHETAEIDLVLAGDLRLSRTVASMSQLHSRVRRPVVVERPSGHRRGVRRIGPGAVRPAPWHRAASRRSAQRRERASPGRRGDAGRGSARHQGDPLRDSGSSPGKAGGFMMIVHLDPHPEGGFRPVWRDRPEVVAGRRSWPVWHSPR